MRLKDKVAIITGGASGIGREIAFGFAREGAVVVIFDLDRDKAEKVCQQIEKDMGRKSLSLCVDVGNSVQVSSAVKATVETFEKIDILVNNAAHLVFRPLIKLNEKDWDKVMEICLKGYFLCAKAVAGEMIVRRSGKIINIGSLTGHIGFAGGTAYGSAKGGVIALTKTIAIELAKFNINVNGISPGPTITPMFAQVPRKDKEARLKRIPAGRFGETKDYVGPAVFFASEASDYVYGQILCVDGGLTAAGVFEMDEN